MNLQLWPGWQGWRVEGESEGHISTAQSVGAGKRGVMGWGKGGEHLQAIEHSIHFCKGASVVDV